MKSDKNHPNRVYLSDHGGALVHGCHSARELPGSAGGRRSGKRRTVTTKTEKERKDKVRISIVTEVIREGLADMGFLVTQEYYFTQVETYTKEKTIFVIIPSSSGFTYSYDGTVLAGVDFSEISVRSDEDRRAIVVDMPASEIQTVTVDQGCLQDLFGEGFPMGVLLKLEGLATSLLAEFRKRREGEERWQAGSWSGRTPRRRPLSAQFITSLPNAADNA